MAEASHPLDHDEQPIADAFYRWAPQEVERRRRAADEALRRARQTNEETRWQAAERAEARHRQLEEMVIRERPYFARIRCTIAEERGARTTLDVRVSNFPRSETFPIGADEMLDVSHLAAVADLVRNPSQTRLTVPFTEKDLMRGAGSGALRVVRARVEDVEWDGRRVARVAPRFGAIFEDRVRRRLAAGPTTSLDAMADVLDPAQSRALADRGEKGRLTILDGPAGTGKTVVAAHRVAVVAPEDSPGLYLVPSETLRAFVAPALPRLGLTGRGTRAATPLTLLADLSPDLADLAAPSPDAPPRDWKTLVDRAAGRDAVGGARRWPPSMRTPDMLLLLAARSGRRLDPAPVWVIADEAQSLAVPVYQALALLAAPNAWWVLAGDLLQGDDSAPRWADLTRPIGIGAGSVRRVWLDRAYRIPPVIHAAAEALRRRLDPGGRHSESVPWHPVPGTVHRMAAAPDRESGAVGAWLAAQDAAAPAGTIAVILPDSASEAEERRVVRLLDALGREPRQLRQDRIYRGGLVVAPLSLVRGLEFEAVLLWDASAGTYPDTPLAGRRVYTALTRARRTATALHAPGAASPWVADWPTDPAYDSGSVGDRGTGSSM
jgi:hypothetical protein